MKGRREYSAEWEEELLFEGQTYARMLQEDVLLLLEVIDEEISKEAVDTYRVAWAFFNILSSSKKSNTERKVFSISM